MSAEENARFAHTVYDAFNRGDLDAVIAMADPEIDVVNVPWRDKFHGRAEFRIYLEGWKEMDPAASVEIVHQLAGDEGVVNECIFRAPHVGMLSSPSGALTPTGKTLEVPFCEVWRIRNGKLLGLTNYADGVSIMEQLGVMPATAHSGA